ncbi:Hint domain-containing protein [Cognatishimia activa]|uniref:Hint domain-containing protein n=1 Tax=Cognatishimia activa TaxID=1715691 RepID=UPI00222E568C|nr:Hint domain-containing protein [Cognatishimia activa]UZD91027.1 Hint domain-containing protein [Cognatishimia activa]
MPATYLDQFWVIDPYSPPAAGTTLTVQKYELVDNDDDGDVGGDGGDTINGIDVDRAYPGDTVTVDNGDGSTTTITGITFYLTDGTRVFTPTDGSVLDDLELVSTTWVSGTGDLDVNDLGPPCLVAGTHVETPDGMMRVEDLSPGMSVVGQDGRLLTLRMVLHTDFNGRELAENDKLRPVRIVAGALGNGLPRRDLLVSRQHRVVVSTQSVLQMFGCDEVLMPAAQLLPLAGFYVDTEFESVTYYHLVFDQHEIIYAEGAATESLYTGEEALKSVSDEAREELMAMFPDLTLAHCAMEPARVIPKNTQQKTLVERIKRNPQNPIQRLG